MAKWISQMNDPGGIDRSSLLQLYESMRSQRNTHRAVIFKDLQFYVALVSALLGFAVTLTAFGLSHILESPAANPLAVSLFGLCILAIPAAGWFIVGHALTSIAKEYQKLAEYLTVEQKLESLLGLDKPLTTQFGSGDDQQIFPDDSCLLYDRWVSSRTHRTSAEFVDRLLESRKGLHVPLADTLRILQALNVLVFVAVAVIVIASALKC
jgi:hypothetical protein